MRLTVVAVAAMLVVGWGSVTAMVEESATAAAEAEEAEDGPGIAPQNSEIASKKGFWQKMCF
jgi:hypothetical protein